MKQYKGLLVFQELFFGSNASDSLIISFTFIAFIFFKKNLYFAMSIPCSIPFLGRLGETLCWVQAPDFVSRSNRSWLEELPKQIESYLVNFYPPLPLSNILTRLMLGSLHQDSQFRTPYQVEQAARY